MKGEQKSQVLLKCIHPIDMSLTVELRGQANHNKIPQSSIRANGDGGYGILKNKLP